MNHVVVRYRTHPDRADENAELVARVFARLNADQPDGIRYATLRLADGVTFVHVASIDTADGSNPLFALPEFTEFTRAIGERCEQPPDGQDATVVGAYGMFEQ
jgi:hypothetical protein